MIVVTNTTVNMLDIMSNSVIRCSQNLSLITQYVSDIILFKDIWWFYKIVGVNLIYKISGSTNMTRVSMSLSDTLPTTPD